MLRLHLFRPAVKHIEERLPIVEHTNRLKQHRRRHAFRRGLYEPHTVRPADTHAGHVKAIDAEVIHQRELIFCIHRPTVSRPNRRGRVAGVALIHGNDAIVVRELGNRVPRDFIPK